MVTILVVMSLEESLTIFGTQFIKHSGLETRGKQRLFGRGGEVYRGRWDKKPAVMSTGGRKTKREGAERLGREIS